MAYHRYRSYYGAGNPNWRGGKHSHPLYWTYCDMLYRCSRSTHARFADYGGRGITVCDAWQRDFWTFVRDMGPRPDGLIMDRIDNNGPYCPENCRWTDYSTSSLNRRTSGWENRVRDARGCFV